MRFYFIETEKGGIEIVNLPFLFNQHFLRDFCAAVILNSVV
jgi:hypothetical protein